MLDLTNKIFIFQNRRSIHEDLFLKPLDDDFKDQVDHLKDLHDVLAGLSEMAQPVISVLFPPRTRLETVLLNAYSECHPYLQSNHYAACGEALVTSEWAEDSFILDSAYVPKFNYLVRAETGLNWIGKLHLKCIGK